MKKIILLASIAGMFTVVSCGPSAEEKQKIELARQDSVQAAEDAMKAAEEAAAAAAAASVAADTATDAMHDTTFHTH